MSYKDKPRREWTPEDHAERNRDNDPTVKLRQENEELKKENETLRQENEELKKPKPE